MTDLNGVRSSVCPTTRSSSLLASVCVTVKRSLLCTSGARWALHDHVSHRLGPSTSLSWFCRACGAVVTSPTARIRTWRDPTSAEPPKVGGRQCLERTTWFGAVNCQRYLYPPFKRNGGQNNPNLWHCLQTLTLKHTMKFFAAVTTLATFLLFLTSTHAQSIDIGPPLPGTIVTPGQNITVEVDKPVRSASALRFYFYFGAAIDCVLQNSLTGSDDVAIVIAMRSCATLPTGSCADFDVSQALGIILYQGPYTPAYQNVSGQGYKPPYQNFTVTVPSSLEAGEAVLSVTHLVLTGVSIWTCLTDCSSITDGLSFFSVQAGPYPYLEVKNVTVTSVD